MNKNKHNTYYIEILNNKNIQQLAYRVSSRNVYVKYNGRSDDNWYSSYTTFKDLKNTSCLRPVPNTYFTLTGQVL